MTVGFIGTGQMGFPMCGHLLDAGHQVVVHDTNAEAVKPLAERQARVAASAILERSTETLTEAGTSYKTLKCVLDLETTDGRIQLTTWFFPGMGIFQQEQRRGPALTRDRKIQFVSGP